MNSVVIKQELEEQDVKVPADARLAESPNQDEGNEQSTGLNEEQNDSSINNNNNTTIEENVDGGHPIKQADQNRHPTCAQEANSAQNEMEQPTGLNGASMGINGQANEGAHRVGYLGPDLAEFFTMRYRNFRVKISKQPTDTLSKYFYEPILLVDPKTIQSQVNNATGQAYVRLTAKMWDVDVEEQVVNWLKKLPESSNVQDHCVQAMPFEKVRLIFREGSIPSTVYRLPEQWKSYRHLPQSLQFHLLCDTKEAADTLADSFRADPEYLMEDLALECITKTISTRNDESYRKRKRLNDGTAGSVSEQFSTILDFNIDNRSSDDQSTRSI